MPAHPSHLRWIAANRDKVRRYNLAYYHRNKVKIAAHIKARRPPVIAACVECGEPFRKIRGAKTCGDACSRKRRKRWMHAADTSDHKRDRMKEYRSRPSSKVLYSQCKARARAELRDWAVVNSLRMRKADVPPEMVELRRAQLKLFRTARDLESESESET